MNDNPFLKIQFDGSSVGEARISVAHLLHFLNNFDKALKRSGMVLLGETNSIRRGSKDKNIKSILALDLVLLTHASPSAVLGFERRNVENSMLEDDPSNCIIESTLKGLAVIQEDGDNLPEGYDAGVLLAWRDAGILFMKGIDKIQFTLNHRKDPIVINYEKSGYEHIQKRIKGPMKNIRTIEGRLLMADFKEHGTRCRVHPSVGEPVLCLFDEEQKDEVLEDILQYVRIIGEAMEDPITGKIASIKIHDIERLEEKEDEATDLIPQGTPLSRNFWESPTLEELAQAQNVNPMADVRALFGTWPGEKDDGFEASIDELRHQSIARELA